jgi:hypothetical protein
MKRVCAAPDRVVPGSSGIDKQSQAAPRIAGRKSATQFS